LILAKIITTITLGADKFKDLPLSQVLITFNSQENPVRHSQQSMSGLWPWKKSPMAISFFFFSQKGENKGSIRIKLCNILIS
jgi:hypothetical protein